MKKTYHHSGSNAALTRGLAFGLGMTAALFILVPIANSLSLNRDDSRKLRTVDTSLPPPPPPPSEPPPPPEQKQEDEKPDLEQKPPPLTLAQLEVALNPGTGSSGGDFGMGGILSQFDVMDEIKIFELSELDKIPRPIHQIAPVYPYEMKRNGITGWVKLVFVVDQTGIVRQISVESSSHREFEQPAIDAVRNWRFEPGFKDGQAVTSRVRAPLNFTMND